MSETKLTPLFLKTASEKFDLDTVFILNLKDRKIHGGIGSLPECTNLLQLDLSQNRITMLTGIDSLINLKIIDLSYNRLTSVDALKGCIKLETIYL